MRVRMWIALFTTIIMAIASPASAQTHVACVGDSITLGAALETTYPEELQTLLGPEFAVQNFGRGGAALSKDSDWPYWKLAEFTASKAWAPGGDVIIQLGSNDAKPYIWSEYSGLFVATCSEMVDVYLRGGAKRIFLNLATPAFVGTRAPYIDAVNVEIRACAAATGATVIDTHSPFVGHPELFADGLHPTEEGAALLARTVYAALTFDAGTDAGPDGEPDSSAPDVIVADAGRVTEPSVQEPSPPSLEGHARGCSTQRRSPLGGVPWMCAPLAILAVVATRRRGAS